MKFPRLAAALLAASALVAPIPAFAESPGEAVAYVFLGVGDGATLSRSGTTMSWKETKVEPPTYEGDVDVRGRKGTLRFIVHANDQCHYEITIEGPPSFVPGSSRLYGRISMGEIKDVKVSADGHKAEIDGPGFCETGTVNPACVAVDSPDLFGAPDPARHKQAVESLIATCGKAS